MQGHEYILSKQIQWALNRGLSLIGSNGERGRPSYTTQLDLNLFEPLEKCIRDQFLEGDGNEILGSSDNPAKMQALHSSSALGVNIFQYWQKRGLTNEIAAACGFSNKGSNYTTKIVFEKKFPIKSQFVIPPNIDVVFQNNEKTTRKVFAVECKFSEAYSSINHDGLKEKYLNESDLWIDIPAIHDLANSISPKDERFIHLHAAQLIKHILGLKKAYGKNGFKLLYLWYDVLGKEGAVHRAEIEQFSKFTRNDSIHFHSMTYQELIIILLTNNYRLEHPKILNI